ncbi:MAG: hypothetical protein K6F28_04425 [Lachnospiraceae bacterium]|nr:hypothetical protein [Lachnospiraceae bacterium]
MDRQKLFRKETLDKLQSPEQLDDYIKVTTPSMWMILTAVIILLAGIFIWAVFGTVTINTDTGRKTVAPITYIIR